MKQFIKKLVREYFDGFDDFDGFDGFDDEFTPNLKSNKSSKIKKDLAALPNVVRLYRILIADRKEDIDLSTPGFHYSMDKKNLLKTHSFLKDKNYFLLTVDAPKKIIDIDSTVENNILYPNEKEVTLKNKGVGSKIISVEPINH